VHKRSGAGTSRPATVTLRGNDSASEPVPGTVSNPGDTHSTAARRCEHSEETDMMLSCVYAGQVKV